MTFFKINIFKKFFQEHFKSVKQVWIQIRINVLSVLIWVQIVSKGYQQMTEVVVARKELNFRCASNLISVCIMVKYIRLQQQESITVTAEICLEIDNCKTALSLIWKWIKDRVALLFEYKTEFFPFKIMS